VVLHPLIALSVVSTCFQLSSLVAQATTRRVTPRAALRRLSGTATRHANSYPLDLFLGIRQAGGAAFALANAPTAHLGIAESSLRWHSRFGARGAKRTRVIPAPPRATWRDLRTKPKAPAAADDGGARFIAGERGFPPAGAAAPVALYVGVMFNRYDHIDVRMMTALADRLLYVLTALSAPP